MGTASNGINSPITNVCKRQEQLSNWEKSIINSAPTKFRDPDRVKFKPEVAFLAACSSSDFSEIGRLLRENVNINTGNLDGLTALHQACIDNNLELITFLLEHGADIHARDSEGWTPLHATALGGHTEVAKHLMKHGADPYIANNDGDLAVDVAESDEMRLLLQNRTSDAEQQLARQAEAVAMQRDAEAWLREGKYRPDVVDPLSKAGPLHVAAAKGYGNVLTTLLNCPDAGIEDRDCDGWSPLHAAAHWGQADACRILVTNGANLSAITNANQSVFDVADENLIPLLKDLKAKQAELMANTSDKKQKQSPAVATLKIDESRVSSMRRSTDTNALNLLKKSSVTRVSQIERHDLMSKSAEIEKHPEMLHRSPLASSESLSSDDELRPPEFRVAPPLLPLREHQATSGGGGGGDDDEGNSKAEEREAEEEENKRRRKKVEEEERGSSPLQLRRAERRKQLQQQLEQHQQQPDDKPQLRVRSSVSATGNNSVNVQQAGRPPAVLVEPSTPPLTPGVVASLKAPSLPSSSPPSSPTPQCEPPRSDSLCGSVAKRRVEIVLRNPARPVTAPPSTSAAAAAAPAAAPAAAAAAANAADRQRPDSNVKRLLHRLESQQESSSSSNSTTSLVKPRNAAATTIEAPTTTAAAAGSETSGRISGTRLGSSSVTSRYESARMSQEAKDRLTSLNGKPAQLSSDSKASAGSSSIESRNRRVSAIMEKKLDESETERRRMSRLNRATKRSTQGVSQEEVQQAKLLMEAKNTAAASPAVVDKPSVASATKFTDSTDSAAVAAVTARQPVSAAAPAAAAASSSSSSSPRFLRRAESTTVAARDASSAISSKRLTSSIGSSISAALGPAAAAAAAAAAAGSRTGGDSGGDSSGGAAAPAAGSSSSRWRPGSYQGNNQGAASSAAAPSSADTVRPAPIGCSASASVSSSSSSTSSSAAAAAAAASDYKKLYDNERANCLRLQQEMARLADELGRLKRESSKVEDKLNEFEANDRAANAESELTRLRLENSKLKADNASLIRVISRLSH